MKARVAVLVAIAVGVAVAFSPAGRAQSSAAIGGRVTSVEEGPMEGVLVSAKRAASTITVTVVSDAQGRYRFPSARLPPGAYTLRIRAVGYDLEGPQTVEVKTDETTTADLKLTPARDLASQLSNSEWLASFPGTEQEKASIRACAHCHTLERVARSRHDVDALTKVIERMSTYPQLSFPMKIQKLVAARIGGGEDPLEQRQAGWRRQAQYLSTVNLSKGDHWSYALKTHPRPKGRATKVIYTEYDLPQRTQAAARRDRRLARVRVVRELRRADSGEARSQDGRRDRIRRPAAQAEDADGNPGRAVRRGRERVDGDAVPGRRREVRPEDGDVPDVESAAGTERRPRADQSGERRIITRWTARSGCRMPAPTP